MEQDKRGLVSTRTMEIFAGGLLFAAGAVLIFDAKRLGSGWSEFGPQSGYFPFYIGLILCISSAVTVLQAWRASGARDAFVERGQARLILAVFIPTVVYVVAVRFLGIYVSSALFIAFFMVWQGKFSWMRSIATGVTVSVMLFLMFELWFTVPLPKGPLETLFGY